MKYMLNLIMLLIIISCQSKQVEDVQKINEAEEINVIDTFSSKGEIVDFFNGEENILLLKKTDTRNTFKIEFQDLDFKKIWEKEFEIEDIQIPKKIKQLNNDIYVLASCTCGKSSLLKLNTNGELIEKKIISQSLSDFLLLNNNLWLIPNGKTESLTKLDRNWKRKEDVKISNKYFSEIDIKRHLLLDKKELLIVGYTYPESQRFERKIQIVRINKGKVVKVLNIPTTRFDDIRFLTKKEETIYLGLENFNPKAKNNLRINKGASIYSMNKDLDYNKIIEVDRISPLELTIEREEFNLYGIESNLVYDDDLKDEIQKDILYNLRLDEEGQILSKENVSEIPITAITTVKGNMVLIYDEEINKSSVILIEK